MGENEQGEAAAAAAAAHVTNQLETVQADLLSNIQKCQVSYGDLDTWNKHVKEKSKKSLNLWKRPAKAGAKAYKKLEILPAKVYELRDKWKEVNTVPDEQLDEVSEESPIYNIAHERLNHLIAEWERCMTEAQTSFGKYKRQDELAAAELGLKILGESHQDVLDVTIDVLDEQNVSKNKPEEPPAGEKPMERSKTEVTMVRKETLPLYSSSPDHSNNDILNTSPILRSGHNNSSGGSSVMTP